MHPYFCTWLLGKRFIYKVLTKSVNTMCFSLLALRNKRIVHKTQFSSTITVCCLILFLLMRHEHDLVPWLSGVFYKLTTIIICDWNPDNRKCQSLNWWHNYTGMRCPQTCWPCLWQVHMAIIRLRVTPVNKTGVLSHSATAADSLNKPELCQRQPVFFPLLQLKVWSIYVSVTHVLSATAS